MASKLAKLDPHIVATALSMTGIQTTTTVAAIIQDVIHVLMEKKNNFSVEDAVEISTRFDAMLEETSKKEDLIRLKERYAVLSSLYEPNSRHKLHKQIGDEMKKILQELERS